MQKTLDTIVIERIFVCVGLNLLALLKVFYYSDGYCENVKSDK